MTTDLFLCRIDVDNRALLDRARRQGLPLRDLDVGYLYHSWVEAAFGPGSLRPFRFEQPDTRRTRLLAYTSLDADALRRHADIFALPDIHAAADWASLATKRMPAVWPTGTRLGFDVRICPTVRHIGEKGTEQDAFLDASARNPDNHTLQREDVYRDWLNAWFARHPEVHLHSANMTGFRLSRLLRRTQGPSRQSHILTYPDVTFTGLLDIMDGDAFPTLLRTGVGRHRAFGFGMLLLVPPR